MERALGYKESLSKSVHDVGTTANMCYVFFLSSVKPITKNKLEQSFGILVKRHPLLRMCIQNINGTYRWKQIDDLKMDIRVDVSDDWHSVFTDTLTEKFDVVKGPLWGLILMPNAVSEFYDNTFSNHTALAFRFMHTIADGLAIINLMNDLQDVLVDDGITLEKLATPFEMPKSLLEFAYHHSNFIERCLLRFEFWGWFKKYFVKPILYRLLPSVVLKTTQFEKYVRDEKTCASHEDATTGICHITVTKEEFAQIHKMCKLNNVTITSVCEAAGNIAMCEIIAKAAKDMGVSEDFLGDDAIIVAPVYRKRLPELSPDRINYLADHSYAIQQNIKISEWKDVGRFWEFAHQVQSFNHSNLFTSLKQTLLAFKLLNYCLSDPSQYIHHFKPEKRWFLLGYTNHGNCNYLNRDSKAGIKVGGLLSGVGGHYYGGVIFHHITTLDNKMIWNVNYATNFCDRAFAERYLQRCVDILKDMCDVKNQN